MKVSKRLVSVAVLIVALLMLGYSTVAYFTTEDTATNVITTGNIDIELQETTSDGSEFTDVVNVVPGQQISKIVKVANKGANDAYVRINLKQFIELANGTRVDEVGNLISLDFNTTNWTEIDGYYYYNKPLLPGQTTEALFEVVTFDTGMGNEYQGSEATIEVNAQATQVQNNGESVFDAAGWPSGEEH